MRIPGQIGQLASSRVGFKHKFNLPITIIFFGAKV